MMTLMHLKKRDHGAHLSRRGFTLVEVMISVGVLAFVIVGLLQLFVYCSTLADAAGNMTLAVNEAQTKMEEIRNYDFDRIVLDYTSTCACANRTDGDGDMQADYPDDPQCISYFDDDESDASENRAVCSGTFSLNQLNGTGTINMTMDYPIDCSTQCDYDLVEVKIIPSWQNKNGRNFWTALTSLIARRERP